MKKTLIIVCVVALLQACLAAVECNKLLNCKTCLDETHCESCPNGYVLDEKKVCRYDCAAKFGIGCEYCTESRCICIDSGTEWNNVTGKCENVRDCTNSDPSVCTYCGFGYDLFDLSGKCKTCGDVFGNGCVECKGNKCTAAKDGFKIVGAIAVAEDGDEPTECSVLHPGCSECDPSDGKCIKCESDKLELIDGFCQFKIPKCAGKEKPIYIRDSLTCGNCSSIDKNCGNCDGHKCTICSAGYGLTNAGTCIDCGKTFTDCIKCQEDVCTKCRSSYIRTPNGCLNQNPYVPPVEDKSGLIAGIVVAAVVLVVIIVLAVYCIISSTAKHGQIDPSVYEDDLEFKSVSVL